MLVIKCVPKNEDSFIQMMQSLNDKKFRYFADLIQGQVISFSNDNSNVTFFRTVRSYCEILAVMNENFRDYPFVDNNMNCFFTNITTKLIALEASNPALTQQILGAFKEICENMISKATSTENTDVPQSENTSSAETDEAKAEEKISKKSEPVDALSAIPEDIKHTMSEKECILFPYVCEGLAAVNNLVRKKEDVCTSEKAQLFLSTIKFPTDAYILKMFLALDDISSITYKNILASPVYAKRQILNDKEIRDKIRDAFRDWAAKTCPTAIETNHLLSFTDILRIYKKFVE